MPLPIASNQPPHSPRASAAPPPGRWRVFLSHTSELRRYPGEGRSYIHNVERAVSAEGHSIADMADFASEDRRSAQVCEREVRACDVYVGVIGLRYGSPVRDRPELSYTELEFETATACGLPRLVFLLDEQSTELNLPAEATRDLQYGPRQEAFRQRLLLDSDLTVQRFRNPAHLGQLVERSLRRLAGDAPSPAANPQAAPVLQVPPLLPYLPDRHVQDEAMGQALRRLLDAEQAQPLVVILHGEDDQRVERFRDRFFGHTVASQFDGSLPMRDFHLPWPAGLTVGETFVEQFLGWIVHHVLGMRESAARLQALAGPTAGPVVLWSSLSSDGWGPEGDRLVEQVCRFWRDCETVQGQRLIHWISIRYDRPPGYVRRSLLLHWLWTGWRHRRRCRRRQRLNDQIRRWLKDMERQQAEHRHVVVLPELESVNLDEARDWVSSKSVEEVVQSQNLRLQLEDEVRRFYRQWHQERGVPRIPMEELAGFLQDQLARAASSR